MYQSPDLHISILNALKKIKHLNFFLPPGWKKNYRGFSLFHMIVTHKMLSYTWVEIKTFFLAISMRKRYFC